MAEFYRTSAYCWPPSVVAGEPVTLHASSPDGPVDVEVVRDGAVAEVAWRRADVPAPP